MEQWKDQGIILSVRGHGENGAIVGILSSENGRQAGYVRGARSGKMRGTLEIGNLVDVSWRARSADNLGSFTLELSQAHAASIMDDPLRLAALQSACALCDSALPEREAHPGLYAGLEALCHTLQSDVWGAAYIMWEIALLRELGFSLNLSTCAGGGDDQDLVYVSPKTGRAVSQAAGTPYKERLLILPRFLRPQDKGAEAEDVLDGLTLTGYFLEHWVFTHHTKGVPEPRLRFQARFAKTVEQQAGAA